MYDTTPLRGEHECKQKEIDEYQAFSMTPTILNGKTILTYAPFRLAHSAYCTLSYWQKVLGILLLNFLFWGVVFEVVYRDLSLVTGAIALLTAAYLLDLGVSTTLALVTVGKTDYSGVATHADVEAYRGSYPTYTILCPLYKETAIVQQFVRAMKNLDYPTDKLQILLLTEEDDVETRSVLYALHLPRYFAVVTVPEGEPRTKPRACNYGLLKATGEYVVIYDAEDIPEPWQLKQAALSFMQGVGNLGCVQARLVSYNPRQNILTRLFAIEYLAWFCIVLPGLTKLGSALPLGGTSNHFRADILRALGAWDAWNVTEDADLGMRLTQYGFRTAMMDSTTYEESPERFKNWLRQRSRWIKGYMQTYAVQLRHPRKLVSWRMALLHLTVGGTALFFLLNPIMWVLTGLYILDRSRVEGVYHQLFPGPVLYAGMLCLVFGNLFYVYLTMLAVMRSRQYSLVPWCLLMPLYWAMMSVAALKALTQLVRRPHYWEKTQHGVSLAPVALLPGTWKEAHKEETQLVPVAVPMQRSVPRLTMAVKAVRVEKRKRRPRPQKAKVRDLGLLVTVVFATICSIVATLYYYNAHEILLYEDARSHMRIARSAFDSLTPGIAQLGSVWLPLPHILMWPFIWNDGLWHSGLAGSLVAMPCYILSCALIYLIIGRITKSVRVSLLGMLVFALNANILYLQSTPLSELVCIATYLLAVYAVLLWVDTDSTLFLVLASVAAFLATMARYDGWPLALAIAFLIPICGFIQHKGKRRILAEMLIYALLSFLGIALWLIWNKMIFGDPLYFGHGPYASITQQLEQLKAGRLFTYHSLWISLKTYSVDAIQTVGVSLAICATLCIGLVFLGKYKLSHKLVLLLLLALFVFYVYSLYGGQAIIWVPGANPSGLAVYMYNVRYGSQMVAPAAIFFAVGISLFESASWIWLRTLSYAGIFLLIMCQSVLLLIPGGISLQDAQYNVTCTYVRNIDNYMYQHYDSGLILEDTASRELDVTATNIDFRNVIYEGSDQYWKNAIASPNHYVTWVVTNPQPGSNDLVAQKLNIHSPTFIENFTLVAQQTDGGMLFHRNGLPPLPNRAPLVQYLYPHHSCIQ